MTKFTLDNIEHEEEDLTDAQKKLVHGVSINQNAIKLFDEVLAGSTERRSSKTR